MVLFLLRCVVFLVYSICRLLLWILGVLATVLFYRRRSAISSLRFSRISDQGVEFEVTKLLMHIGVLSCVVVVLHRLLPLCCRAALPYLRQTDLLWHWCGCCWGFLKRAGLSSLLPRRWRAGDHAPVLCHGLLLPRCFSYRELEAATNRFSKERKLGSGSFGVIYKGVLENGEEIAVKKLNKWKAESYNQTEQGQFRNEAQLLHLRHGNIVQLVGYCCEGEERILCFEYMRNGSLDKFLFGRRSATLDWEDRYRIIKGLCRGLRYRHEECLKQTLHLDIKPDNILLDDNMNPKISDFGLSRLFDHGTTHSTPSILAPRGYTAPEYIRSGIISDKADIYSLGVLLLEIATDKHNFSFDRTTTDNFITYAST